MTPAAAEMAEAAVAGALARAAVYRLLGGVFAYPEPGFVSGLPAAADAAGAAAPPAVRGALERLAVAAREAEASALAAAYVATFDRQVACSPHEGGYGAPQVAGKAAQLADVAGFYAAFGLAPGGGRAELEDHIAAELEFMSVLALKEAAALAEGEDEHVEITRAAAAAFLRDHLGRWGEAFAEAVTETDPAPYYAAGAAALGAWLRAETEALGPGAPPLARRGPDAGEAEALVCPMAEPSRVDEP